MTPSEIENIIIKSLDATLTAVEQTTLAKAISEDASLAKQLSDHKEIRSALQRTEAASFGQYFAVKLLARIENSGVIIERQIFSFFKKYQLLAAGVVAALLILNTIYSEHLTLDSILGLQNESTTTEEIVSFDFNDLLNSDL